MKNNINTSREFPTGIIFYEKIQRYKDAQRRNK